MKARKFILGPLIVLIMSVTACSSAANQTGNQLQQIEVVRGDLTSKILGSGKITVITDARLSFGSGGKLISLNVKENDRVTSGQVLAKLDTTALEVALAQAKVTQNQSLLAQVQAKLTLDQTRLAQAQYQTALDQAKLSQIQASASLTTAQFYLDQMKPVSDIENTINQLQTQLDTVKAEQHIAALNGQNTTEYIQYAAALQLDLAKQQLKLATLLSGPNYTGANSLTYNIMGQTYDRLTVENVRMKQLAVEAAQKAVEISAGGIAIAQTNLDQSSDKITIAQTNLNQSGDTIALAQKNIDYIQKQINDSTLTAPFAGTIAALYYKQGDIIPSPAVTPQIVIYLIDTDHLEVSATIDELDSPSLQVGQNAIIRIDALPGLSIDGTISAVSTTPNAQAAAIGVTAYIVRVAFNVPQDLNVKTGMNADVDIVSQLRKNVLLLPNQTIKQDNQGNSYVQVVKNQNITNQPVVIGAQEGTNTEIISGLQEGDKVVNGIAWSLLGK